MGLERMGDEILEQVRDAVGGSGIPANNDQREWARALPVSRVAELEAAALIQSFCVAVGS